MGICEPWLTLSIVSSSQTDALVSDYSSKDRPSIGQETRWLVPAVERPARGIFAPSIAQPRGKSGHLSTLLRELANTGICLPEIGFGTWNYGGGVEPHTRRGNMELKIPLCFPASRESELFTQAVVISRTEFRQGV
jgi:hypothetical protein